MSDATTKQKGAAKTARAFGKATIPIVPAERLKKPDWIRVRMGDSRRFQEIKDVLRSHQLHTVCEEASCPNISECFGKGTATFMILGDLCTRRCPFCDVAHGRPQAPDENEPINLATTIAALKLKYVVITSVDRDDLRDGGAGHFAACIKAVRELSPATRIEVLVPDFRGRLDVGTRHPRGRSARRDEPQPRNRAAPVQARAARRRLRQLARTAAAIQNAFAARAHQVGAHAGARRDRRRNHAGAARPACA
jgi:hypothetical protein